MNGEEIIRPDLNLERWPIWQPSNAREANGNKPKEKILEKPITLDDGTPATAKVIVTVSRDGALTTEDQKTWFALCAIWFNKGRIIDGPTGFSVSEILRILKRQRSGSNVAHISRSLKRLRYNHIIFERAFFSGKTKRRITEHLDGITILTELKTKREDEEDDTYIKERGVFKFHPLILENLLANYTKPVIFDEVLTCKTDIGQMLYLYVDRQLTNKNQVKITSKKLFDDLGITGEQYKYTSDRKRTLTRAINDVHNKSLSSGGVITEAKLELTKDQKDVNAIFQKGGAEQTTDKIQEVKIQKIQLTSDSDEDLVERLIAEGVSEKKAHELVNQYPLGCRKQLDALPLRDLTKVKNRAAWLSVAIIDGYEIPAIADEKQTEPRQNQIKEVENLAQISCIFCKEYADTSVRGMRKVYTKRQPGGAMKTCSHDPAIESEFSVQPL